MPKPDRPSNVEHVACQVCMKEVPRSEAKVPEATEYLVYFCGLDCYEKWKKDAEARGEAEKGTGG